MELHKIHIGDIGKIITGKTPRTCIHENYGGEVPFLTPSDDLSHKHVDRTQKYLSPLGVSEVESCVLPPNSICVSCIGSDLGKAILTKEPLVTNQQFNSIIPNKNFDAEYVYYLMKLIGQELNYLSKTSTAVPIINKSTFSSFEINVLPQDEQHKVAMLLSSLDDKIELNTRINHNLEQMAQALYKSWFIDFEPFKDGKFVDSELGSIPEGWRVGSILDVAVLYDNLRQPLSSMQRAKMQKIYPYYGATSIMDYVDDFKFDGIYLLLGEDGSVVDDKGYPYIQYVNGKFWPNNHAHVLQGKNGYSTEMLHAFLAQTVISSVITGAVQAKLSQGNMKKIRMVIASQDVLYKFDEYLQPLYNLIRIKTKEISRLTKIRDDILPKLMSGKLKINDFNK